MTRIALVANRFFGLSNSRTNLVRQLVEQGHEVHAYASSRHDPAGQNCRAVLEEVGASCSEVPFPAGRVTPYGEARASFRLSEALRTRDIAVAILFNLRPIVAGAVCDAVGRQPPRRINVVTGLGAASQGHGDVVGRTGRFLVGRALRGAAATIFQNPDDHAEWAHRQPHAAQTFRTIVSSGVDTDRFRPHTDSRSGPPAVLMATRMLHSKGVLDYLEAARRIRASNPSVRFLLAGEMDPDHPDAIPDGRLRVAVRDAGAEYLGFVAGIEDLLRTVSVFVLPSYYPEGVPRSALEAAASAVPVITSDVRGCREAVVDGDTGYLIEPRRPEAIAERLVHLLQEPAVRTAMGMRARARIIAEFSDERVTSRYLTIIEAITGGATLQEVDP